MGTDSFRQVISSRRAVVLVTVCLTHALMLLAPSEPMVAFATRYGSIGLLALSVGFLAHRARQRDGTHSAFWSLLAWGFGLWLVAESLFVFLPARSGTIQLNLTSEVLNLLSYALVLMAIDGTPRGWERPQGLPVRFRQLGTLIMIVTVFFYFSVVPSRVNPDAYQTFLPSALLYGVLDALLLVRVIVAMPRIHGGDRTVYRIIGAASALWLLTDALEALRAVDRLGFEWAVAGQFAYCLPIGMIAAASLVPRAEDRVSAEETSIAQSVSSLLIAYAIFLPALHLFGYAMGFLDPQSHGAREFVVLTNLTLLIALALTQHRLMVRRNRALQTEIAASRLTEQILESRKMEAIGRLAGGVAHDFNNLLTVILGNSALLARTTTDPDQVSQIGAIREAGDRAAELTRRLLAFGRREVLDTETVDINAEIEAMMPLLRPVGIGEVEIRTDLGPERMSIRMERSGLSQIVLNLVINAREGISRQGRIEIRTRRTPGAADERTASGAPAQWVTLEVRDTGRGIPAQRLERIFEPYFTGSEHGVGLGLAIVHGLVEQAGGTIAVESRVGVGTTFRLRFPAVSSREEPKAAESRSNGNGERLHVLVVDDQDGVRDVAAAFLREAGHQTTLCSNGREALAALEECEPPVDVLLTDVKMPEMGGFELGSRAHVQFQDLRVIYMSGYAQEPELREDALGRFETFLSKPFERHQLAAALEAVAGTESRLSAS
ncbi:MAG: hypothetical protein DHS20C21_09490 [Gemmatimonadota bacterium]|nr:MAG: hypothetical protein DHS20C21_09490 [Gemmatimonadota bacterium]